MAEDKKEEIYEFLKNHPGERFSMKELREKMSNISYPCVLKWIEVLKAEGRIKVEDYGNLKLVEFKGEEDE